MRRPLCLACLFFILFIRTFYVCFPPVLPDYIDLQGREVYIRGQVVSIKMQEINDKLQQVYTLDEVIYKENSAGDEHYFPDKILYYTSQINSDVHIGSLLWGRGRFALFDTAENPGQFDSRFYYYMQGIGASIYDGELIWGDGAQNLLQSFLQNIKKAFSEKLDVYFTPEYAGVMKALLLGDKSTLDTELKQVFKEGGILHILTISGLHISMLGMGCFHILRKMGVPRKAAAVSGFFIVIFYGMMIGSQAAAFRAICMFGMQMAAILVGRTYDRLTGLSVAAVLLLLEQPMYVFYSGFLLSFGAVLGVTILSPAIERWSKERGTFIEKSGKIFAGGIGVFVATFPIQLYSYYEYPLYSTLINVLVLPFLPYIVGLGAIILAVPGSISMAAVPFVYGCQGLLTAYEWICTKARSLPGHCLVIGAPSGWQMILYYGCLILLIWAVTGYRRPGKRFLQLSLAGCFVVSAVLLVWRPEAGFVCQFLSVGQGDCCIIQCNGETYIADCGSTSRSKVGTQILLPCLKYYGISKVNGVFLSHADEDHINGIVQWLQEYEHSHVEMERILLPDLETEALKSEFGEILELADKRKIPVATLAAGQVLSIGDLRVEILHPEAGCEKVEDANGYSQVLFFSYQNHNILLTGDIGSEQERNLTCGSVSVLKVAHHGSKYSSSAVFLEHVKPQHAILSYGIGNRYGHPHSVVEERLKQTGAVLWYTGRQGAIKCCVRDYNLIMESFPFR